MVLEDATVPPDFATDSSPGSDADRYGNTSFIQVPVQMELPLVFRLLGLKPERVTALRLADVRRFSNILQRPMTPEETQALFEHSAERLAVLGNLTALGVGLGLLRAYQTRATYRFPFYQPKLDKFNASRFLGVEHPHARILWHFMRTGGYGTFGMIFGVFLAVNFAATVTATREARDPRLKDAYRALMEKTQAEIRRRKGAAASTARGRPDVQAVASEGHPDDASPSSAYSGENNDYGTLALPGKGNVGDRMLSDQDMRSMERRQQASSPTSPTSNTSSTFEMDKVARQPRGFDDPFDDASPTAGSQPLDRVSADVSGQSAWDRLRRQAASSNSSSSSSSTTQPSSSRPRTIRSSSPPSSSSSETSAEGQESVWAQRRQRAFEGDGGDSSSASSASWSSVDTSSRPTPQDSFSFSSTERERQLAKAEAQRAFDEQVERERRGGQ